MDQSHIRNLCIIAHIDHGKSTLADRLLLRTGAITPREFRAQLLDDMDLERERGITIKASAVRMSYQAADGESYLLNLIDTPGHVDFSYEVAKSLRACEGALLVVDASQGVQAQTVANLHQAAELNLAIIPVMQALVFDSAFDPYKGVVVYVRLMNGRLKARETVLLMGTGRTHEVQEVGLFTPRAQQVEGLSCGQVGYFTSNIKEPKEIHPGETITLMKAPAKEPLPGYRPIRPMVFCGIYPVNPGDYDQLRDCMPKLQLSDASFTYEPETSSSFGMGFRCGFLGLLHMEIIQERLEREFGLNLVATTPSVVHRAVLRDGEAVEV
ncbi:MAG: GTP-binding protein, partial [Candidatus Omnitrophica bacterium]|nr:GTP-binding protein [Candidatus Omnitrophota bacterium]